MSFNFLNNASNQVKDFIKDNFIFIKNKDQVGYDLYSVAQTGMINNIIRDYPNYCAFNTLGYLKYDIPNIKEVDIFSDETSGIYVKKDYYFELYDSSGNPIVDLPLKPMKSLEECEEYTNLIIKIPIFIGNKTKTTIPKTNVFNLSEPNYLDVYNILYPNVLDEFHFDTLIDDSNNDYNCQKNIIKYGISRSIDNIIIYNVNVWNNFDVETKDTYKQTSHYTGNGKKMVIYSKLLIKVFMHLYAINNWRDIAKRQFSKIKKIPNVKIYVFVISISQEETCIIFEIKDYLSELIGNSDFVYRYTKEKNNESFTLSNIRYYVDDNDVVIYLHNKGVTRYGTNEITIGEVVHYSPNLYENIVSWCELMEYWLIENWDYSVSKLFDLKLNCNVVGCNYLDNPPHFSGNFWMTTGKFIRDIRATSTDECFCATSPDFRPYSIVNTCGQNGYYHYFNPVDKKDMSSFFIS